MFFMYVEINYFQIYRKYQNWEVELGAPDSVHIPCLVLDNRHRFMLK